MQRLKTLIAGDDLIIAPGALNPIMGKMMKEAHKTTELDKKVLEIEARTMGDG